MTHTTVPVIFDLDGTLVDPAGGITGGIAAALAELTTGGAELIDETPRVGLFGLQVAFVHPDAVHGVLTEVVCPA